MIGGAIYSFRNPNNNRYYIGQSTDPKKRYWQHNNNATNGRQPKNHFYRAIRKYGIEYFEYNIICEIKMPNYEKYKEEIDKLERYYIKYYNAYINGYNRTEGGGNTWAEFNRTRKGGTLSESHKLKLRESYKNPNRKKTIPNRAFEKNNKAKSVIEIDNNGIVINTYACGKTVAIKYNINYSTFRSRMKNNTLIINGNKFIWN